MRKLIKYFKFENANRSRITLGTGMRLNLDVLPPGLTLAEGYNEAEARTWVTNPSTVKQWLSFEAVIDHQYIGGAVAGGAPAQQPLTSAAYRLGDGTNEYWWDGGAWVVNTTNWNTEAEVATNINAFPIASQSLQVVVKLATSQDGLTPRLRELKVLWLSDIEFMEDILYRSLVPALRDNIRPIADYPINPGTTGAPLATIDLNDYPLETPYNIVGIAAVYDHSADPNHLTNVFGSYDAGTKVITLATPIPDGNLVWVRFTYEPEVAVTTSADYNEVSKVPALLLDDVDLVDASPRSHDDSVINKGTNAATSVPAPIQGDLEVTLHGFTDKGVDGKRLADAIKAFFQNHPTVRSVGLDEEYSLWLITEYDMRTPPGAADLHTGQTRFRVRHVVFYVRDSVDKTGVKRFLMTGSEDFAIRETA